MIKVEEAGSQCWRRLQGYSCGPASGSVIEGYVWNTKCTPTSSDVDVVLLQDDVNLWHLDENL